MPKRNPTATPKVVGGLSRARVLRATRPGRLRNNPRQVVVGGDVTRCRSGQAEPAVDGTCVRKGVTGGARAPRALSLWNALVRAGSSGILVGYPAHTGRRGTLARREARAPIRKSANGVWSALLGSNIRCQTMAQRIARK
ncbi:hypothetical protein TIFTF001_036160 [Ficus carica]|uniref:Uncharacterized protein n=1 Tax=Ficus carica TaxID=3494 RepID=A0AA88E696_FICCA|nr:hypothetical protein TIFTF001_036145 [Ficus carica]GMN67090.1 hypothetical protein TIFTF001_036160 [Ficus carica]